MRTPLALLLTVLLVPSLSCNDAGHEEHIVAVVTSVPVMEIDFRAGMDWSSLGRLEGSSALEARMEHYGVPGVGLAVVDDYEVAWTSGHGVLVAGETTPASGKTRFEAGSTTKMVTAVAVLHYLNAYGLGLDQNPEDALKGWRFPESEFTRDEPVTIRRLLTHTAGVNRPDGGFSFEDGSSPTLIDVLGGTSPATNQALALEFVPGERSQYSNMGYLVLQKMLMDITGKPFPELMDEALFLPLDMKASGFEYELPADEVPRPHDPEGTSYQPGLHPSAFAQGGLRATPSDLARLVAEVMRSYAGTSEAILQSEITRAALSSQVDPSPSAQALGFTGQGLGFMLMDSDRGVVFTHPGFNAPGATCMFLAFPETGQAAVIMTNGARGLELSLEILSAVAVEYGWPRIGANEESPAGD